MGINQHNSNYLNQAKKQSNKQLFNYWKFFFHKIKNRSKNLNYYNIYHNLLYKVCKYHYYYCNKIYFHNQYIYSMNYFSKNILVNNQCSYQKHFNRKSILQSIISILSANSKWNYQGIKILFNIRILLEYYHMKYLNYLHKNKYNFRIIKIH